MPPTANAAATKPLRVLIVEDSPNDAELMIGDLESRGYELTCERVESASQMAAALERHVWDVVLSDYNLPHFSGLDALHTLQASGHDLPFIIVSGTIGEETAVNALKAGAHDFLIKGNLARLGPAIERELREVSERRERARTQEALYQSEARFRSLVQHAVFGICQTTTDWHFLAVNPALVTMLGYDSAEELLDISLPQLCADPEARMDLLNRVSKLKVFTGEEMTWLNKSGGSVRVRLSGRVVETAPEQQILEVIVEDITERQRLQSQLQQSQKMEGIGRLAGGIAHDFNNMLTTIMGYSDMIVEQIGDDKPISADLREIRHAADRAADLTRQLLAFSRQQVLRIGPVNVNDVVGDMRAMLQRLIGEDIAIEPILSDELRPILADRVQLEQVLMNIAANARDAMPRGGRLTMETRSSRAREVVKALGLDVPPGNYVTLALGDTGEGMDAVTRDRIFEPFFTTKELGKGTGLGLATVYGIVKQLGGYISVASELGVGTTFTLFFPESEPGAQAEGLSSAQPIDVAVATSREMVLVVEDEASLRRLVVRTLARHGYRVVEAENGHEGLVQAELAGAGLHLVISDVIMPTMGGAEMVGLLRTSRPTIKVLYMSGYAGDVIARGNVLDANTPFMEKPFAARDLLERVREVLDAP